MINYLDVDAVTRASTRRVFRHRIGFIKIKQTIKSHWEFLRWIDAYTTGTFFLGLNAISFEKEQDAIIFKLGYAL